MHNNRKYQALIGIDTGTNTGFAIWNRTTKSFVEISTLKIHQAIFRIKEMHDNGQSILVRVEDARKRKWFGNAGREKLQGAGSVKRDASVMEDFLKDYNIPFELVAPKSNKTKLDAKQFKQITGFTGITNVHGRDAAMMVYGL